MLGENVYGTKLCTCVDVCVCGNTVVVLVTFVCESECHYNPISARQQK